MPEERGPWEDYQPAAATASGPWQDYRPAPELSPWQKFTRTLQTPQLVSDLAGVFTGNPAAAYRLGQTASGMGEGIAREPARIWNESRSAAEAALRGDAPQAARHMAGMVPLLGAQAQDIADTYASGGTAEGNAKLADLIMQLGMSEGAPLAEALVRGGKTAAVAVPGAVRGAWREARAPATVTVPLKLGPLKAEFQGPGILANAEAGAATGALLGTPVGMKAPGAIVGGVVGATRPIIRGAIRGGRAALEERVAAAAETARLAREQALMEAPPEIPTQVPAETPPLTPAQAALQAAMEPPTERTVPATVQTSPAASAPLETPAAAVPEQTAPAAAATGGLQGPALDAAQKLQQELVANGWHPTVEATPEPGMPTRDTYAAIGRANKADAVAKALNERGITYAHTLGMTPEQWQMVTEATGHALDNPETIAQVRARLQLLEKANPPQAPAGPTLVPPVQPAAVGAVPDALAGKPGALDLAQKLQQEMVQGGWQPPAAVETEAAAAGKPPKLVAAQPDTLAELLNNHGISYADSGLMTPEQWAGLADAVGMKKPGPKAIKQSRARLQLLEQGGMPASIGALPPAEVEQAFQAARAAPGAYETLDAAAENAMQRMRDRGSFSGSKLNAMPDPADVADLAIWGAAKMAQGVVEFPKWSKQMIAEFGDQIRPTLQSVYTQSQKNLDRHIRTTQNQLPKTRELLQRIKTGEAGKDWYTETHAELVKMFGPDAELMEKFLAATSPNNTVPGNVSQALKAYRQYRTGQAFEGYLPLHAEYLNAIAKDEPFGGLKVDSFLRNLKGETLPVTVDRWIARAFRFGDSPTPAQYKFMDYWLTQLSKRAGMEPSQVQAAIWKAVKEAEQRAAGSSSEPFERLLPKKIASDPEMQALIARAKAGEAVPARP